MDSEVGGFGVVANGVVCSWDWLRVSARAVGARVSAVARGWRWVLAGQGGVPNNCVQ
jgi:hypothetical protein